MGSDKINLIFRKAKWQLLTFQIVNCAKYISMSTLQILAHHMYLVDYLGQLIGKNVGMYVGK